MKLFSSVGNYFALDIGTTAVRVVELRGSNGSWTLDKFASVPVDIRVSGSDAPEDQRKLGEIIATAIGQSGIKSKDVIVGIPSNKMFATVIDVPDMPANELAATIKYQAEQFIPMSIDEAKVDWAVLGKSINDQTKVEVLLASVANTFSENRLDLIEGLGLNVVAIEPDSVALTRSLLPAGVKDARLIIEISDFSTDIIMTYGDAPRLIRSLPSGLQTMVKAIAQNLNIEQPQAAQFILKFGMLPDKLEGQVVRSLTTTVDQFVSEIVKSVKFFQTRYPKIPVGGMIVSEYGVTVPGLASYVGQKVGLPVELGNPWQKVTVSSAMQNSMQGTSAQFAVALGLAQRGPEV